MADKHESWKEPTRRVASPRSRRSLSSAGLVPRGVHAPGTRLGRLLVALAVLIVIPSTSNARWIEECATGPKNMGGGLTLPVTECRTVWVEDPPQDVTKNYDLFMKICTDLGGTKRECALKFVKTLTSAQQDQ